MDVLTTISYDINNPSNLKVEGNIKEERLKDFIADFVETQIGTGRDDTPSKMSTQ